MEVALEEIEWWDFEKFTDMAEQVVGDIGFVVESAIEAHGGARIALSADRSVDHILSALAKSDIEWPKVTIIPTDDLLAPSTDPLSNHGRLIKFFGPLGAEVVPLVDEAALDDYREAGRIANERLSLLHWPLDLVMLHVGEDGHTASIFPGPDFERAVAGPRERRAVGIRPDPIPDEAPVDRITLTSAAISSARAVMIVLSGHEKRQVVEKAIEEGPLSSKPIGRVITDLDAAIDIFWSAE